MTQGARGDLSPRRNLAAFIVSIAMIGGACGSNGSSTPTGPTPTVSTVVVTSGATSASSFQLTATARLSDGTSRDVTAAASWQSSNPAVVAVSAGGLVTVLGAGELDVRATYQGVTGSLHLLVTKVPPVSLTVTGSPSSSLIVFQATALARLADGTSLDVTRSASWDSSNPQLATVTSTGFITIVGNGDVDIRATYQGVTGSMHVRVSLPERFTLSGVVMEAAPNAQQLAGARAQLVGGDHAFSDTQGVFSIPNIVNGRLILEVSKEGYQTYSIELVLDRNLQLAITLYPTPPTNGGGASATARCKDGSWSWAATRADACAVNGGIAYPVCPGPLCTPP